MKPPKKAASKWCVYLLRCGDGSLYCGITNDFAKRFKAHVAGKGARYTRGRGPLRLAYREPCADRSGALKREHAVKQLSRAGKQQLIAAAKGKQIRAGGRSRSGRQVVARRGGAP